MTRIVPLAMAVALLTSCGSTPEAPRKPAQYLTVQQLASTLGCQANVTGPAADFRQATCTVSGTQVILLDFDTPAAQRAWLEGAIAYGGNYLVGDRWTLAGESKEYLESLQPTLGGTLEAGDSHTPAAPRHGTH